MKKVENRGVYSPNSLVKEEVTLLLDKVRLRMDRMFNNEDIITGRFLLFVTESILLYSPTFLKIMIFLPPHSNCWNNKCEPIPQLRWYPSRSFWEWVGKGLGLVSLIKKKKNCRKGTEVVFSCTFYSKRGQKTGEKKRPGESFFYI